MIRRVILAIVTGAIALSFIPLSMILDRGSEAQGYRVAGGVMDVAGWDAEKDGKIKLDGEWEFYWNRFLEPRERSSLEADRPIPDARLNVPGQWNGKKINNAELPAHGYATYRMILRNVPADVSLAIKKTNIRFASAIYANGVKLFEDGRAASNDEAYRAGNSPQLGLFASDGGDIEILVHVANYDYANSGIPVSLILGEQSDMLSAFQRSKSIAFGTFAVLSTIALVFFISYAGAALYRNRDDTLLMLGFLCLFFAGYNGLIDERALTMFLPEWSFETLYKIKDICSMICFIVMALYFYRMKHQLLPRWFLIVVAVVLGGFAVLVAALPIPVYSAIQPIAMVVYVALYLWLLLRTAYHYARSEAGERLEAFLWYAAMIGIVLFCVDMILFSFFVKDNIRVGQAGIVIFSVIALLIAVLRFFVAYRTVNEMKDRLLRMDRIKDDFLSTTSHELKTPLNAIVNIAGGLLKGVEGPLSDNQARNLAIVMDSGRRLTYLVDELLDYSKMRHGDVLLHRTGVDLSSYVDSVIRIHRFLLGGKTLDIVNDVPANMPAVYADGNRLVQILHNLIGNAVKFTERGAITVTAKIARDMVEIRVSDTGPGIASEELDRIFLPFEQGGERSERHAGGTGLGLSITRKLVELHGGRIRAESATGEGATLVFTLPLAAASEQNVAAPPPAELDVGPSLQQEEYPKFVAGEDGGARILVVDDDAANLQTIGNWLKLEGYGYVAANRGQSALELLGQSSRYHLAIVDIRMPDLSGYEVLRRIRERYSPFELPVLMLTASNKADELRLSLEGGANDFVAKPFESEELLARVRGLIRLKASVEEANAAEIAFLRSQINPHFLHNALNAIAELCIGEPEKAEGLTLQLSQYLRSSIGFKQLTSLTRLENELELVEAYAAIEKARFGDRLEISYDIDADPGLLLPPLILQPLVENAIRHGLMSSMRGGRVSLSVKHRDGNALSFAVTDDGIGMNELKLEKVLAQPVTDKVKGGVGLWNINRRLKLLYGRSLRIDSEEGRGTTITFELPARAERADGRLEDAAGHDRG